jgi:hypothetical protein
MEFYINPINNWDKIFYKGREHNVTNEGLVIDQRVTNYKSIFKDAG